MFVLKTILWGTIFLFIALIIGPWLALQFDNSFPPFYIGEYKYIGLCLITIGLILAIYCTSILFIPGKARPAPYDAGGVFVIGGPYNYVRNPFMLGVILALWGEAIFMQRTAMAIYALFFTWAIHFWVIFFEEPALESRFGDEFHSYKSQVPRWFPRLRKYIFG